MSTRSQCWYNKGIGPSDLTSCSSLMDSLGANFSYSRVSVKLSPPNLPETMPECARAPAPAELPRSSPDSTLILGGREPDAGQMVEVDPGSGHLRGRAKQRMEDRWACTWAWRSWMEGPRLEGKGDPPMSLQTVISAQPNRFFPPTVTLPKPLWE